MCNADGCDVAIWNIELMECLASEGFVVDVYRCSQWAFGRSPVVVGSISVHDWCRGEDFW